MKSLWQEASEDDCSTPSSSLHEQSGSSHQDIMHMVWHKEVRWNEVVWSQLHNTWSMVVHNRKWNSCVLIISKGRDSLLSTTPLFFSFLLQQWGSCGLTFVNNTTNMKSGNKLTVLVPYLVFHCFLKPSGKYRNVIFLSSIFPNYRTKFNCLILQEVMQLSFPYLICRFLALIAPIKAHQLNRIIYQGTLLLTLNTNTYTYIWHTLLN